MNAAQGSSGFLPFHRHYTAGQAPPPLLHSTNRIYNSRLLHLRVASFTARNCTSDDCNHQQAVAKSEEEEPQCSSSSPNEATTAPGKNLRKKNLFLLDVAPLCYTGKKPSPSALLGWLRPLLVDITRNSPVVAVMDGSRGNEYRRNLLSTYKANRNSFVALSSSKARQTWKGDDADLREAFPFIKDFLHSCNIPVASMEDSEADDVVATLADQAVQRGMQVTIASPDKDFKQLLSENIQIIVPLSDLKRWSYYTHKHYFDQHKCQPQIELSLRCLLGDKADDIPGLADLVPGFGRNTALKLLKKHGSLENLLTEAGKRTVGKPYVQNALTDHAFDLWRNIEVLRLRRNLPVCLKEEWCGARDISRDLEAFQMLEQLLKHLQVQRALKDGVKTATFSKRTFLGSSKRKTTQTSPGL